MVAKRVGPAPHASKTMSGSFNPVCGRAPGSLDTLTTRATLSSSSGSVSGRPVSGCTGGGRVVVVGAIVVDVVELVDVVAAIVVVGAVVVVGVLAAGTDAGTDGVEAVAAFLSALLQAPRMTAPPASVSSRRRESRDNIVACSAGSGAFVASARFVMVPFGGALVVRQRGCRRRRPATAGPRRINGTTASVAKSVNRHPPHGPPARRPGRPTNRHGVAPRAS